MDQPVDLINSVAATSLTIIAVTVFAAVTVASVALVGKGLLVFLRAIAVLGRGGPRLFSWFAEAPARPPDPPPPPAPPEVSL